MDHVYTAHVRAFHVHTTLLLYGRYILNMAYMMYVRRTFIVYILPGMITTVPVGLWRSSRTYVTVYN